MALSLENEIGQPHGDFANGPADPSTEQGIGHFWSEQNLEKYQDLNAESAAAEPNSGGKATTSAIFPAHREAAAHGEANGVREAANEAGAVGIGELVVHVGESAEAEDSNTERVENEQKSQNLMDIMTLWMDTNGMLMETKPAISLGEFQVFCRDPVLQGMSNVPEADHVDNLQAELLDLATQFQQSALWSKVVMSTIKRDGGCSGYDELLTELWTELEAGSAARRACPEVETRVQCMAAELKTYHDLAAKYGLWHDDDGLIAFGGRIEDELNRYYGLIKNVHEATEKAKSGLAERTDCRNRAETEQRKLESQISEAKDALRKAEADVMCGVGKRDDLRAKLQQSINTAELQEAEYDKLVIGRVEARETALQDEERKISGQYKTHEQILMKLQMAYHAELRVHGKPGDSSPLLKHLPQVRTAPKTGEVNSQPSLSSL